MADEELKSCEVCGATIYPEHIDGGRAALWAGQLLCPVCLTEKKAEKAASPEAPAPTEDEPLSLVAEEELDETRSITAFGAKGVAARVVLDETKLKRPLNKSGAGATRMRIFHTKINDGAAVFMTQTINEWIDANPDIEVKFVGSAVGIWEGKHPEPHLILTLWY